MRSRSLRLTLLGVVALVTLFVIGAPTALAGDDTGLAEPPLAEPPATAVEPAPQAAPGAAAEQATNDPVPAAPDPSGSPAGQELHNEAASQASNEAQVGQTADQAQQVEGSAGIGQTQQLEQSAGINQEADSAASAEQETANAGDPGTDQDLGNEAGSEASNEAVVEQDAEQEQGAGGASGGGEASGDSGASGDGGAFGGGGNGQIQQAEQLAEINQDAASQAIGEQQATTAAPLPLPAPLDTGGIDWSALLTQLPWAGGIEEILAGAQNGSLVFQAIWQVQQGCKNHCTRTSQSQSATQHAGTTQDATAIADPSESESSGGTPATSTAEARNRSVTVQFVWQTQIGCVAFCVETSQTQTATQWAQTSQPATAEGGSSALAENLSETLQLVWQLQEGCLQECYGTSQVQVINQGEETTQSANATSGAGILVPVLGADGAVVLPGWLVALAENLGVTIQTIYQLQEAVCAEYCEGDSQLQAAVQQADVSQEATARVGEPPVPVEAPPSGQPPIPAPPQQPGEQPGQPQGQAPASSNSPVALAALSDPSSPASRRLRSQLIKLASRGPESQLRSLALVLPSDGQTPAPKPSPISGDSLKPAFTALAADSANRPKAKSPALQGADSLASTTFGLPPHGTTDGGSRGWLWIGLLAASLALLPALRQVTRWSARTGL